MNLYYILALKHTDILKGIECKNSILQRELKIMDKIEQLKQENEKLKRENLGLKTKIKNLEEKLYKRYESFKGEVTDKEIRRRNW